MDKERKALLDKLVTTPIPHVHSIVPGFDPLDKWLHNLRVLGFTHDEIEQSISEARARLRNIGPMWLQSTHRLIAK